MNPIRSLLDRPCAWLTGDGSSDDIVLSSRIRLARNLSGRPFPQRARRGERGAVLQEVFEKTQNLVPARGVHHLSLESLSLVEREFLGERQLVSRDLVETPEARGLVVVEDESASFMVNEEDHLRVQAIRAGLDLDAAFQGADGLDSELDARLDFAYSERLGFLTACPTNTGTGMRASVLMHFPGVVLAKELDKMFEKLRQQHLTVRGFHGEGSAALGNFFQISNTMTLGVREPEILEKLDQTARDLVAWEHRARESLLRRARSLLEDKVWRSFGILRYARVLTSQEALSHTSLLRLGVGIGILDVSVRTLNEILIHSQPAHAALLGGNDSPGDRDAWRAQMVREKLQLAAS